MKAWIGSFPEGRREVPVGQVVLTVAHLVMDRYQVLLVQAAAHFDPGLYNRDIFGEVSKDYVKKSPYIRPVCSEILRVLNLCPLLALIFNNCVVRFTGI